MKRGHINYKGFIGNKDSFISLTPADTIRVSEDFYMGCGYGDNSINMGTKGEMRVESNSQYAWCLFQRQQGVVQGDVMMSARWGELRSEKSDGGFWSRNGSSPFIRP